MTRTVALLLTLAFASSALTAEPQITPLDKAAGWRSLFDGTSHDAWRGYRQAGFPAEGWDLADGSLRVRGGGDIITKDQFADFDLMFDWAAMEAGANSGVIYRVTEQHDAPWQTGPEYQLLDDAGSHHRDNPKQVAGAIFDLYAAEGDKQLKPVGEYNHTRIWLRRGVLKHWLNGVKVVECELGGDDWKARVAASKFAAFDGFGVQPKGHIDLQDHGNEFRFRDIRVRDLDAPLPHETKLFNGKDFEGWTAFLKDDGKLEDVWSIDDGVLICTGQPAGYIRTKDQYANFILKLEWRWSPEKNQPGNSGVLFRCVGEDKVWPACIEAQLQHENAGDFWNIGEFPMKTDPARLKGRNTKKTHMAERPVGQWNEYEIIVNHGDITLIVNGETLNTATEAKEVPGWIALQSEGAEIHFRNIRLSPLP